MRGLILSDFEKELDEVFGMTSYGGEIVSFLLTFLKQANIFNYIFSDDDDNDELNLGDAVLYAWKSVKIG